VGLPRTRLLSSSGIPGHTIEGVYVFSIYLGSKRHKSNDAAFCLLRRSMPIAFIHKTSMLEHTSLYLSLLVLDVLA